MIGFQHVLYPSMLAYTSPTSCSPNASSRSSTPSALKATVPSDHATPTDQDNTSIGSGVEESMDIGNQAPVQDESSTRKPVIQRLSRRHSEHPTKEVHTHQSTGRGAASSTRSSERSRVHFSDFAASIRQQRYRERRYRILQCQRTALQKSIALSGRLTRTSGMVQKGLCESLKFLDSPSFVAVYNAIQDLRRQCELTWTRDVQVSEPLPVEAHCAPSDDRQCVAFLQKLPKKSREDLFQILQLVRTSPEFLIDRLRSLSPNQISALTSQSTQQGRPNSVLSSISKGASPGSYWNRNLEHLHAPKEKAVSFERTDVLSALLHNVFGSPLSDFPGESQVRLAVWSSTCAELFFDPGKDFRTFVGEVITSFALSSEWRAKQELELFLMERLQNGAVLLERVKSTSATTFQEPEYVDAMNTDLADEFFDTAVKGLFEILDDLDGGLPQGALEIGSAILGKLDVVDHQSQFRGFLFFQWYFCNFLPNAIIHPESHGMLLEHHISSDAREKLLRGIYLRAQAQASSFLNPLAQFSSGSSELDERTGSMISHLVEMDVPMPFSDSTLGPEEPTLLSEHSASLTLSVADCICILDGLFPRHKSLLSTWDPMPASGLSVFSAQSHLGRTVPAAQQHDPSFYTEHTILPDFTAPSSIAGVHSQSSSHQLSGHPPNPTRNDLSRKADRVRRVMLDNGAIEARPSTVHPCAEDWSVILVDTRSQELMYMPRHLEDDYDLEGFHRKMENEHSGVVQEAARRLVSPVTEPLDIGSLSIHSFDSSNRSFSLEDMFHMELDRCQSQSDLVGEHYWSRALQHLRKSYPLSCLNGDDTKVLQPMIDSSTASIRRSGRTLLDLENEVSCLNESFEQLKGVLKNMTSSLERLRNKMWYMHDVKNSAVYENSKNVALALKNMALPAELVQQVAGSSAASRAPHRSLAGSLLKKPEVQTLNIMKASIEHGGPKKLADEQIELTRKWLIRQGIDNFCKGEERIHRFCFEMKSLAGNLGGETMMEGRVLRSSDLYAHERALFERHTGRSLPSFGSARPSSIVSDEGSFNAPYTYHGQRAADAVSKLQSTENPQTPTRKPSFQSMVSDRWRGTKDNHLNDSASISDSPGKAVSTSTMDSVNTFWSPFPTNAQSAASASSYHSRPASLYNETSQSRQIEENAPAKAVFLDGLRQNLNSLLLSDLGSPTWNRDSETDRWFSWATGQEGIRVGVEKLARVTKLLSKDEDLEQAPSRQRARAAPHLRHQRSISAGPVLGHRDSSLRQSSPTKTRIDIDEPGFSYETAFGQLIEKCSRHANPVLKLHALHDLKRLVIYSLQNDRLEATEEHKLAGLRARRDSNIESHVFTPHDNSRQMPTERRIVHALKQVLFDTKPKTIFRDLQFISAFVPSDVLNKTESGQAFLQVGLAALALKEDVCKVMVGMADRMIAQEVNQQPSPDPIKAESIMKAASQYWMFAAKEDNAVAQRELAILYLTHSHLLPRITLPLTLSKDTFKAEMEYWHDDTKAKWKSEPQTMCLALHWMQLSASNGDEIAKNRLKEREEFDSVL